MKKVTVYLLNTELLNEEVLLSSPYLNDINPSFFNKFKCLEVKKEKIGSTILKKKYVGNYYIDEKGKPLSDHIYFNISHSKGMVAIVLEKDSPIGIDIEQIREASDDLKRYVTTDKEYQYIKDDKSFFEIWTSKESLCKCLGCGLNRVIKEIPALPLNGKKEYLNNSLVSKQIEYNNFIISVTLMSDIDDEIEIVLENISL